MNDGRTHLPAEAVSDAKDGIVADTMNIRHKGGKLNVHLDQMDEDLIGKVDTANLATINGQRLDEKKNIVIGGGEGGGIIPDTEVIQGSPNAVSGGAVYDALKDLGSTSASLPSARIDLTSSLEDGAYYANLKGWTETCFGASADGNIIYNDKEYYKEFFLTKRLCGYVGGCKKFAAETNCELVAFDFDKDRNCVGSRYILDKNNIDVRDDAVKLVLMQGTAVDIPLEQGDFENPSSSVFCKSTPAINVNDFDFLLLPENCYIAPRCFDLEGKYINYGYKLIKGQAYITKEYIVKRYSVDGKKVGSVRLIIRDENKAVRDDLFVKKVQLNSELPFLKIKGDATIKISRDSGKLGGSFDVTSQIYYQTALAHDDGRKHLNKILLRLPKNYSADGNPVPLIFFRTGTSGFANLETSEFNYLEQIKYLVDEGFAVYDATGWADITWEDSYVGAYPSFGTPTNYACYMSAYNYVRQHYNVRQNQIFLSGKSLGGMTLSLLPYMNLPVAAVGGIAPELEMYTKGFGYTYTDRLKAFEDFGVALPADTNFLNKEKFYEFRPATDKEYYDFLKKNLTKITGYLPLAQGVTNKTPDQLLINEQEEHNMDMANAFPDVIKHCPCPILMITTEDDVIVRPARITNYIDCLKRGGCIAEYIMYPAGHGGHHAVDTDPNAPKVENVTTRLGVHYDSVPKAYYEVAQWFIRFGG